MNPTFSTPTFTSNYVCAHCGQPIDRDELVHLREQCALPEECTHHVHKRCASSFVEEHAGNWKRISADSIDAGWLVY